MSEILFSNVLNTSTPPALMTVIYISFECLYHSLMSDILVPSKEMKWKVFLFCIVTITILKNLPLKLFQFDWEMKESVQFVLEK